jgi:hypothetical protein
VIAFVSSRPPSFLFLLFPKLNEGYDIGVFLDVVEVHGNLSKTYLVGHEAKILQNCRPRILFSSHLLYPF